SFTYFWRFFDRGIQVMGPARQTSVERIIDTDHLDDLLSEPTEAVIEALRQPGDILILGVAGKRGPTLARMARRASEEAGVRRRVIGVARFSDSSQEANLKGWGLETIRCDLLEPAQLESLPEAPHVIYLVGTKFGSTGREAFTWATNCWPPGM